MHILQAASLFWMRTVTNLTAVPPGNNDSSTPCPCPSTKPIPTSWSASKTTSTTFTAICWAGKYDDAVVLFQRWTWWFARACKGFQGCVIMLGKRVVAVMMTCFPFQACELHMNTGSGMLPNSHASKRQMEIRWTLFITCYCLLTKSHLINCVDWRQPPQPPPIDPHHEHAVA